MSRQVVITVDDLGVDPRTISLVADLAAAGRVSAASVIPMAPSATRAVQLLAASAGSGAKRSLSIGLHATFTGDGAAGWAPLTGGRSLVSTAGGTFHDDVGDFAATADPREVLGELEAQVAWFDAEGIRPTHLDSHEGALYGIDGPGFLTSTVRVCAAHELALRLPRVVPDGLGALVGPAMRQAHRQSVELADDLGVVLPETIGTEWRPLSDLSGYTDLRDAYLTLLRSLPEGLSEIFLHPAMEPGTAGVRVASLQKRLWERRLLQDDAFGEVLAEEDIRVVPWPLPPSGTLRQ
jgi:hypothetical protein